MAWDGSETAAQAFEKAAEIDQTSISSGEGTPGDSMSNTG